MQMPEPTPKKGEKEKDFIDRCMSDPTMKREYPKKADEEQPEQRLAVCYRQWNDRNKKKAAGPIEDRLLRCAAQHFGPWAVEPYWFIQAVNAVRDGTMQPRNQAELDADIGGEYEKQGGIAKIGIYGQMTKGQSSFGGTSTVLTRRAIRKAVGDADVGAILLHIDSPGGTVAGTAELAAEVARAHEQKPTHAYIDDLGASAAYWVASQAGRITANAGAMIGSIGSVLTLYDTSGKAEKEGIKVHNISTGPLKGAFTDGTPITPEQLAHAQHLIDELNEQMLTTIKTGRKMRIDSLRKLADGRLFVGQEAVDVGLIDGIESLDDTVGALRQQVAANAKGRRRTAEARIRLAEVR